MENSSPLLFHDPTSEPSRAVYWFALAAGIPVVAEKEHDNEKVGNHAIESEEDTSWIIILS